MLAGEMEGFWRGHIALHYRSSVVEMDLKRKGRIPKWNLIGETRGEYKALAEGLGVLDCASGSHHAYVNACKATDSSLSLSPSTMLHCLPCVARLVSTKDSSFAAPNQRMNAVSVTTSH